MILFVIDAFIVVIDSHGQSHFSVVLSNDIFVEDLFNFLRLREIGNLFSRRFLEFLVEHLVAQGNALIANENIMASNQFLDLTLLLTAKEQV